MRLNLSVLLPALLLTLCVACSPGSHPVEEVDPIPLPEVPAQFKSTTLVVPEELQDEFAGLIANPPDDWYNLDASTFSGELRRAIVYWRFSFRSADGNGCWLHLDATDRRASESFINALAAGWGMSIEERYYTAKDRRAHYDLYRTATPPFTLGEIAWLNEWLLLNYPEFYLDCTPHYHYSHSEGAGGTI